jgi:3-methylcrotonyl-CoA carboxylase alpha subunit
VTEEITGLDLVEWQFRVAANEKLPLTQSQIRLAGHAVEARLYAEDPEHGFLPSTGRIAALEFPKDIRVDSGVAAGGEVTPFYDAMIAKLIAHAPTREAALDKLAAALDQTLIAGPRSNLAFLTKLCRASEFRQGKVDTGFIERNLAALGAEPQPLDKAAAALGAAHLLAANDQASLADDAPDDSPWAVRDGFQLGGARVTTLPIMVDGESETATVTYGNWGMSVAVDGVPAAGDAKVFEAAGETYVLRGGRQTRVHLKNFAAGAAAASAGDGVVKAPMHGKVLEILAQPGDRVTAGQRLAVIEAMKMEHTLRAPFDGAVTQVAVDAGAQVVEGAQIMVLEPDNKAIE